MEVFFLVCLPELVSGSILEYLEKIWTLKRVQGDKPGEGVAR